MLTKTVVLENKLYKTLADEKSNIIFEHDPITGQCRCRRSSLEVNIPNEILEKFGSKLSDLDIDKLLLSFRNQDTEKIEEIFETLATISSEEMLSYLNDCKLEYRYSSKKNVPINRKLKQILMVAGLGDAEGRPLTYSFPHVGIEGIAYRLNRESLVDARVYNPNMTSLDELVNYVNTEKPDLITLSVMETTFPKSVEVMGALISNNHNISYFWGGPTMPNAPLKEILESFPVDGVFVDEGKALIDLASIIDDGVDIKKALKDFGPLSGVITSDNIQYLKEKPLKFRSNIDNQLTKDIPYATRDLTTGKFGYISSDNKNKVPIPRGKLSRNPLYVNEDMLGNGCHGRCIFCSLTLNTQKPKTACQVFNYIKTEIARNHHDSIYFGAPNLFEDENFLFDLISLIKKDSEILSLPKRGTVRVDYKNQTIIKALKEAGFVALAFGIETFYQPSLFGIGKATTREMNLHALDHTISVGMYPIVFNILMSRKSTILSVIEDIEILLNYVEKGAALETVPYLSTFWGTVSSKLNESELAPTIYNYKWMKKPFKFQRHVKYDDPKLELVRDEALKILDKKLRFEKWPKYARNSFTFYSLLLDQSYIESSYIIAPEKISKDKHDRLCAKIDILINELLKEEAATL